MDSNSNSRRDRFNHNTGWKSKNVAENYDERRFTSIGGRIYDKMEKRAILKCLDSANHLSQIQTILDAACGTGRISEFLIQQDYKLTCGDISSQMLDVAKERLQASGYGYNVTNLLNLDIYDTRQASNNFDCVTAFRLFQHLTSVQRAQVLQEMARVSRRFVVVNVMYTSRYYDVVRRFRYKLGRYTTRYTSSKAEIEREIDYAGLKLVKSILTQPGFNGNCVLLLEKTYSDGT